MSQAIGTMQLMNVLGAQQNVPPELAQKLDKLEGSCKDFEAIFTGKLLEVMRKTVPQNELINGGRAEEIFTGMLDEEMSKMMAEGNGLGVAKMMFEQMKQQLLQGKGLQDPKLMELGKELLKSQLENGKDGQGTSQMLIPAQGLTPANPQINDATDLLLQNSNLNANAQTPALDPNSLLVDQMADDDQNAVTPQLLNTEAAEIPVGNNNLTDILKQLLDKNQATSVQTDKTADQNNLVGQQATQNLTDPKAVQDLTDRQAIQDLLAKMVNGNTKGQQVPVLHTMIVPENQKGIQVPENNGQVNQPVSTLNPADAAKSQSDLLNNLTQKIANVTVEETGSSPIQQAAVNELNKVEQDKQNGNENVFAVQPSEDGLKQEAVNTYRRIHLGDEKAGFSRRISRNLETEQTQDVALQPKGDTLNLDERRFTIARNDAQMTDLSANALPQNGKSQTIDTSATRPDLTALTNDLNSRMKRMDVLNQSKMADAIKNIEEPAKIINQIVKKAELLLKNGMSEMKIELEPKQLGQIKISVVMQNDVLTAKIFAKNDAVGDIIRTNLNQLGSSLKDLGYNVGSFDVSSGGDYENPGQQPQPSDSQNNGRGSFAGMLDNQEPDNTVWPEQPLLIYQAKGIYSFDVVA
jgi:peptidoglycan hydrolase FlgJ